MTWQNLLNLIAITNLSDDFPIRSESLCKNQVNLLKVINISKFFWIFDIIIIYIAIVLWIYISILYSWSIAKSVSIILWMSCRT